jgi:hypothetical protein
MVAFVALIASAPALGQAERGADSEKLASDLMESRTCETGQQTGNTACHYSYRGLRFTRYVPAQKMPFVNVEALQPPMMIAVGSSPSVCLAIAIVEGGAEKRPAVFFNVVDGKFYLSGRDCRGAGR